MWLHANGRATSETHPPNTDGVAASNQHLDRTPHSATLDRARAYKSNRLLPTSILTPSPPQEQIAAQLVCEIRICIIGLAKACASRAADILSWLPVFMNHGGQTSSLTRVARRRTSLSGTRRGRRLAALRHGDVGEVELVRTLLAGLLLDELRVEGEALRQEDATLIREVDEVHHQRGAHDDVTKVDEELKTEATSQ